MLLAFKASLWFVSHSRIAHVIRLTNSFLFLQFIRLFCVFFSLLMLLLPPSSSTTPLFHYILGAALVLAFGLETFKTELAARPLTRGLIKVNDQLLSRQFPTTTTNEFFRIMATKSFNCSFLRLRHYNMMPFFLLFSFSLASTFCHVLLQEDRRSFAYGGGKGVIGVVATATQREKLHPLLLPGRGCHFMHQVFHLHSPKEVTAKKKAVP